MDKIIMENKKRKIDMIRDAAFSMDVKKKGETEPEPLINMLSAKGMLLALKPSSIFRVQMPDDIDPERKYIETKGSISEIYTIGTSNPIVARTLIQGKKFLEFAPIDKKQKEALFDTYFDVFHEMVEAYKGYQNLHTEFNALLTEYKQALVENNHPLFISDVPHIESLEVKTKSFFASIHRSLKILIDFAYLMFPDLSKPLFFSEISKKLEELYSEDLPLISLLKDRTEWINIMWKIRNAIEHPKPGLLVEIKNMQLAPNGKIDPPTISYEIESSKLEKSDLIEVMGYVIEGLLEFSEAFLITSILSKRPQNLMLSFYRIPNENIDPNCPILYNVTFNP
jgi:hypothetical protein